MRDTFLARSYIPASANGGFRPSLLSFPGRISVGGSGGIFGRGFRVSLALPGTRWADWPAVLVSVIAFRCAYSVVDSV